MGERARRPQTVSRRFRSAHMSKWTRLASNAGSVLASDAANRAATFVLYALVGRTLGAFEFGQMSLALTFFYIFQIIAGAGVKTYVTREIAKDASATGRMLASGCLLVVAFS